MSTAEQLRTAQHQARQAQVGNLGQNDLEQSSGQQHGDDYNKPQQVDNYNQDPSTSSLQQGSGQAGQAEKNKPDSSQVADTTDPRNESLRAQVLNKQKAESKMARLKSQADNKLDSKVFNPAKKGTGTLLKMAWDVLIPSWGLSIIYLDLHVFLRAVMGDKLFCKLGDEWLPDSVGDLGGAKGMVGLVETMVLIFVNFVYFGIIFSIIALIVMIMGWVAHPLDAIMQLGWTGVTGLVNLFKGLL